MGFPVPPVRDAVSPPISARLVAATSLITLTDPSPAVGRAQVVTQGISELPGSQYVMRVVQRTAPALGDAKVGRRVLGFALATDEPILITDVDPDGKFKDRARLAPGEAYMTLDGHRQIRASLSGKPTQYLSIEFVSPDQASTLAPASCSSSATRLPRRPVSATSTSSAMSSPSKTSPRCLIPADRSCYWPPMARSISCRSVRAASTPVRRERGRQRGRDRDSPFPKSAYGVPTNELGELTNMLQTDNPVAGYVVVVIGPEVPKTGEPTPSDNRSAIGDQRRRRSAEATSDSKHSARSA